ncbi:hypothetical protein IAT38_006302 [Cryptococcus sp. DSM 104549]
MTIRAKPESQGAFRARMEMWKEDQVQEDGWAIGGWTVHRQLGKGGMGVVKLAEHEDGHFGAIKLGHRELTDRVEVEAMLHLQKLYGGPHPNILELYEMWELPTHFVFALELANGGDLGVASCHAAGVFHRDLKPPNILLVPLEPGHGHESVAKIADFGLAIVGDDEEGEQWRDGRRGWCGTPGYIAPEYANGRWWRPSDNDVWSLGVILFELLTGYNHFHRPRNGAIDSRFPPCPLDTCEGKFIMPDEIQGWARDVLVRMLERDPEKRITVSLIPMTLNHNTTDRPQLAQLRAHPYLNKSVLIEAESTPPGWAWHPPACAPRHPPPAKLPPAARHAPAAAAGEDEPAPSSEESTSFDSADEHASVDAAEPASASAPRVLAGSPPPRAPTRLAVVKGDAPRGTSDADEIDSSSFVVYLDDKWMSVDTRMSSDVDMDMDFSSGSSLDIDMFYSVPVSSSSRDAAESVYFCAVDTPDSQRTTPRTESVITSKHPRAALTLAPPSGPSPPPTPSTPLIRLTLPPFLPAGATPPPVA